MSRFFRRTRRFYTLVFIFSGFVFYPLIQLEWLDKLSQEQPEVKGDMHYMKSNNKPKAAIPRRMNASSVLMYNKVPSKEPAAPKAPDVLEVPEVENAHDAPKAPDFLPHTINKTHNNDTANNIKRDKILSVLPESVNDHMMIMAYTTQGIKPEPTGKFKAPQYNPVTCKPKTSYFYPKVHKTGSSTTSNILWR